jgi:hypothetical protein
MLLIAPTYTRTIEGRYIAFGPSNTLDGTLKKLLRAVDSKTTTSTLEIQHAKLGNVAQLLKQLEAEGLIQDKKHAASNSSFIDNSGFAASSQFADSSAINYEGANHAGSGQASTRDGVLAKQLPQGVQAQAYGKAENWVTTVPGGLGEAPSESSENLTAQRVQAITDTMATFVLTYLPGQAFSMLKELESLRTHAQLQACLPSYAQLAQTAGTAGRQHLAELDQSIQRDF